MKPLLKFILLDDLILVPLGIAAAIRLIPARVLAECRANAYATLASGDHSGRAAAATIVGLWLLAAALAAYWLLAE